MKAITLIVCLSLFVVGCATPPQQNLRVATIPEVNKTTTVEIGQTIISKAFVKSRPAIFISSEIVDSISQKPIPSGLFPLAKEDGMGKYFESGSKVERSNWEYIPQVFIYKTVERSVTGESGSVGVFVPHDKTKPAVGYVSDGSVKGTVPVVGIQHTVSEEWSQGAFKRELIYTGVAKNVISILYREFKDDIARPAFSQDIKYDLSESKVIGYRGSRFEVIQATNTGITYKVLRDID